MNAQDIGAVSLEKVSGRRKKMPSENVMDRWAAGKLHSGSKSGPVVKNQKQAVAIMESEKKKEAAGKPEYQLTAGARFPKMKRGKHGK